VTRPATERRIARRVAVLAAVLVPSGYAVVRLAAPARPDGPPTSPLGADPSNPPILIEGGTFLRGSENIHPDIDPASPFSMIDESPPHPATVEGFWIQQHEVTNEEYGRFDPGHAFPSGEERHPVVDITWREAMSYAVFLGGSLPTEAQWEFAARGTESRRYPWGDAEPTCERAQFEGCDPTGTLEVMSRPEGATPEGIHDLAGNVWEWVMPDWHERGRTPVNDESIRLRGGSYLDEGFFLRASNRNNGFHPRFKWVNIGFRVAWSIGGGGR